MTRTVRGIRSPIPTGHVIGRTSLGDGDAELIPIADLGQQLTGLVPLTGNPTLSAAADKTVVSNISGASALPTNNTLTAVLDHDVGNTQGNVLYRNATAWVVLAPGTNGQSLLTSGAAANPSWSYPAASTLTGTTLASNVVTSSLTTVGTIGTGTWQGTKVGLAFGGTNADLSATGGAHNFLAQASAGAAVTVVQPATGDLSDIGTFNLSTSGTSSAASYTATGTAGAGFIALPNQTSDPAAIAGAILVYTRGTSRDICFREPGGNRLFIRVDTAANGNEYTFPAVGASTLIGSGDTGTVTNTMLANSSITIAGHAVSLGGSQTLATSDLTDIGTFSLNTTGTATATELITSGNVSAAAWGSNGIGLQLKANTYTDTTSSGTVAQNTVHSFLAPTLAASNVTTYTNAATLRIGNAPIAGTNVTITNAYALLVNAGTSNFGGSVNLAAGGTLTGTLSGGTLTGTFSGTGTSTAINQSFKACTSTLTKTNDTALATITGLSVALTAGGTYVIGGHLTGTSGASGGIKVALVASGGLTATSASFTGTVYNGTTAVAFTTVTALGSNIAASTAIYTDMWIDGAIVVNVAGTINVQGAQNATNATSTTFLVNSNFWAVRVS